jgi:hypothetical protein
MHRFDVVMYCVAGMMPVVKAVCRNIARPFTGRPARGDVLEKV